MRTDNFQKKNAALGSKKVPKYVIIIIASSHPPTPRAPPPPCAPASPRPSSPSLSQSSMLWPVDCSRGRPPECVLYASLILGGGVSSQGDDVVSIPPPPILALIVDVTTAHLMWPSSSMAMQQRPVSFWSSSCPFLHSLSIVTDVVGLVERRRRQ